jgi:glyoxylase I family protein
VGLDHTSFAVASRKVLEDAVALMDAHGVPDSEVPDLGEAFGIAILIFRDPDNIQLELSAPR